MLSNAFSHIIITFCHAMHFVLHLIARYLSVSAFASFPVDPETAVDPEYDYITEDQISSAEQPGKQNPLDHSDIAYSFSLHSCIRYWF